MASVAVLSRASLAKAALCSKVDIALPKTSASVSGCPSFAGKKLLARIEPVEQRRAFSFTVRAADVETTSKNSKGKTSVEDAAQNAASAVKTTVDDATKSKPAEAAKSSAANAASAAKSASDSAVPSAPAESAQEDSIVPEVAKLEEAGDTAGVAPKKKPGRLSAGGTLSGAAAEGKAPSDATLGKMALLTPDGKFQDPRWKDGNWDLAQFTKDGKTNWDAVIDAEVVRRTWLERNPESSTNEDPVFFDTGVVPWWAWVKRFHLPEAEKLNGRAAMVGYASAWLVDAATGVGLVDQQGSFFGKLLLLLTVVGVLVIRKNADLSNIKELADEWTFYDKQWQATWKDGPPSAGQDGSEEKKF